MAPSGFPFDCIVVTCPDAKAADAARRGPLKNLERSLNDSNCSVTVVATSDPFGSRCGSGGGTLAALEALELELLRRTKENGDGEINILDINMDNDFLADRVTLVLHAGGDSSRCPNQMVVGKAWASLPLNQRHQRIGSHTRSKNNDNDANNPTVLLIDQLAQLLKHLQDAELGLVTPGTVVVAATDTLLQLFEEETIELFNDDNFRPAQASTPAVIGIAVPAPLTTAKNHGVYVLDKEQPKITSPKTTKSLARLQAPRLVLQKPPLKLLRDDDSIHFFLDEHHSSKKNNGNDLRLAWIDTGIIIFLPNAREVLRRLSFGLLANCTTRGLTHAFHDQHKHRSIPGNESEGTTIIFDNSPGQDSLTNFAKHSALKVDLYTDLLHSFEFGTESMSSLPPNETTLQSELRKCLGKLPLQVLALNAGKFLHLGTTQEWVDFLVDNVSLRDTDSHSHTIDERPKLQHQQLKLACVGRHSCWTGPAKDSSISETSVLFNSIVEPTDSLRIGHGTVVEHCLVPMVDEARTITAATSTPDMRSCDVILVGANCLLSGLRLAVDVAAGVVVPSTSTRANNATGPETALETSSSTSSASFGSLIVPDNMHIQMVAMKETGKLVYIVLGMRDDIKQVPCQSLYNLSLDQACSIMLGMDGNYDDVVASERAAGELIWPSSLTARSIWNAKIHPVVDEGTQLEVVFAWLLYKLQMIQQCSTHVEGMKPSFDERYARLTHDSLKAWHSARRISLKELHGLADASREWEFRSRLTTSIITTRRQIFHQKWKEYWDATVNGGQKNRQSEQEASSRALGSINYETCQIDWTWLIDLSRYEADEARQELWQVLEVLHGVAIRSFSSREYYPNCARALMVASSLTAEIALSLGTAKCFQSEAGGKTSCFSPSCDVMVQGNTSLEVLRSSLGWNTQTEDVSLQPLTLLLKQLQKAVQRDESFNGDAIMRRCSEIYEQAAGCLTEKCVVDGKMESLSDVAKSLSMSGIKRVPTLNQWVICTAPARIDLSGGWSDTPPICFLNGMVTGLAVTVDGKKAVSCRCRIVPGRKGLLLRSELRHDDDSMNNRGPSMVAGSKPSSFEVAAVREVSDLRDYRNPLSDCALLKAALVVLGLLSLEEIRDWTDERPFQARINEFCGMPESEDVCLEIVSTTTIPKGSGLGTSSILGGCIVLSISKVIGSEYMEDANNLIYSVLVLEQLLTAGGGYQDQVNGLIGGVKTVSSKSSRCGLEISVQRLDISHTVADELNDRLVLAFTGKTRLAKNILQNVLRRWARRTPEIVHTVQGLLTGAQTAQEALLCGNLSLLGDCLNRYWEQKKTMAGNETEPAIVRQALSLLFESQAIVGASLCGAGGGGFLVLLASPGMDKSRIEALAKDLEPKCPGLDRFTWHACRICDEGVTCRHLNGTMSAETFDISWHESQTQRE